MLRSPGRDVNSRLPHFTPSSCSVNTRHTVEAGEPDWGTFPDFHRDDGLPHVDVALLHMEGVTVLAVLNIFRAALELAATVHSAEQHHHDDDQCQWWWWSGHGLDLSVV